MIIIKNPRYVRLYFMEYQRGDGRVWEFQNNVVRNVICHWIGIRGMVGV